MEDDDNARQKNKEQSIAIQEWEVKARSGGGRIPGATIPHHIVIPPRNLVIRRYKL